MRDDSTDIVFEKRLHQLEEDPDPRIEYRARDDNRTTGDDFCNSNFIQSRKVVPSYLRISHATNDPV